MPRPRTIIMINLILLFTFSFTLRGLGYVSDREYSRDLFGGWADYDHDNMNTRHEMLLAYTISPFTILNPEGTMVILGMWSCPYTGNIFTDPKDVDVDHIVPLKWAWSAGAKHWSNQQREEFANDPQNLLVVSSIANRSKGALGPSCWIPSRLGYVREYIARFVYVCEKYKLPYPKEKFEYIIDYVKDKEKGISLQRIT